MLIIHRKANRMLMMANSDGIFPQKQKKILHRLRLPIVSRGISTKKMHRGMIKEIKKMARVLRK